MNVVWRGKATLAEVVAAETGAKLRPRWWQFWKQRNRPKPRNLLDQVQDPELRKIIEQITREYPPKGHDFGNFPDPLGVQVASYSKSRFTGARPSLTTTLNPSRQRLRSNPIS